MVLIKILFDIFSIITFYKNIKNLSFKLIIEIFAFLLIKPFILY